MANEDNGSKREVITEDEILAQPCTDCLVPAKFPCRSKDRHALTLVEGSNEFAFHRIRILTAYAVQLQNRFTKPLSAVDKALIVYYGFVLLCDSASVHSKEMMGKEFTSQDVQAFFIARAIEELKKDKLIA